SVPALSSQTARHLEWATRQTKGVQLCRLPPFRTEREKDGAPHFVCDSECPRKGWATGPKFGALLLGEEEMYSGELGASRAADRSVRATPYLGGRSRSQASR